MRSMKHSWSTPADDAARAVVARARITSLLTTITTPAKYVAYSAHAVTRFWHQYVMTRHSYDRSHVTSTIRQHEQYWADVTGRSTQTEGDE